jgi:hypothetical protein
LKNRSLAALAVVLLIVVAGVALSCTAAPENRAPLAFDIQPAPPWHLSGTGQATINADGDLVLKVSVRGPAAEVTRVAPYGLPGNILWHLYLGDCAARLRDAPGHVLFQWYVDPQSSDAYVYMQVIPRGVLDASAAPYAIAAYRNGGGALYACGDIPALPNLAS